MCSVVVVTGAEAAAAITYDSVSLLPAVLLPILDEPICVCVFLLFRSFYIYIHTYILEGISISVHSPSYKLIYSMFVHSYVKDRAYTNVVLL